MTIHTVILELVREVIRYLRLDWWILGLGIAMAVAMKVYIGDKVVKIAQTKSRFSIPGAVGIGAFTPLCACGTMAVLLSMFASSLPWGTIMAFLLTSPLTSPTQFIFQAGFLGTRLAVASLISALGLGLTAGALASRLESRTAFFRGQYRLAPKSSSCETCTNTIPDRTVSCCEPGGISSGSQSSCTGSNNLLANKQRRFKQWKLDQVFIQIFELGVKRIVLYFALFIALGKLVEMFIPAEPILLLFSPDKFYSIPLAALVGLPLYVSGAAGLPLLESFIKAGAGEGAVLAFLIAGQGTSVGVMLGISAFIKKRAIAYYVTMVLAGAILSGLIYQLLTSI